MQVQFLGQQQKFLVFFKCCLFIDYLFFVYYLLVIYYSQWQKQKLFILDMYNIVMFGWVWQGVFRELVYVLLMVKDVGFILDLLFYVVIFQCMGRQDQDVGIIERCLEQMSQEGLKLQVFFIVVFLFEEEQVMVLKVVYKVKFIFSFLLWLLFEVNILKLFRVVYVKDGLVFYLKLYLFLKILQLFFEKQFCVELVSKVCVVFVEKFVLLSKEVMYVWKILQILWDYWEKVLCWVLWEIKNYLEGEVYKGWFLLYFFLCLLDECEVVWMFLQVLQVLFVQGEFFIILVWELSVCIFSWYVVQRQWFSGQVQVFEMYYRKYLYLLVCDIKVFNFCLLWQYWEELGVFEVLWEQFWFLLVQMELGKQLVEMLVQVMWMLFSLDNLYGFFWFVFVFYYVYFFCNVQQIGVLKLYLVYVQLLEMVVEFMLIFEVVDVFMLCFLLFWILLYMGVFLFSFIKLMCMVEGVMQYQELLEICLFIVLYGVLDVFI